MADEAVFAIGSLTGGGRRASRNRPIRPIAKLVSDIEVEAFALVTDAGAEEMPVQIRDQGLVMRRGHRIFIENISGADVPVIVEIIFGQAVEFPPLRSTYQ